LSYDKDIDRRVELAAGIISYLRNVWKAKDISKSANTKFYQTGTVRPTIQ